MFNSEDALTAITFIILVIAILFVGVNIASSSEDDCFTEMKELSAMYSDREELKTLKETAESKCRNNMDTKENCETVLSGLDSLLFFADMQFELQKRSMTDKGCIDMRLFR